MRNGSLSYIPRFLSDLKRLFALSVRSQSTCFSPTRNLRDVFHHFDALLLKSASLNHVKQVHARALVTGNTASAFLVSRFITVYSSFGDLIISRQVFDASLSKCWSNILFWNSILRVHVRHEYYRDALCFFFKMRCIGVLGDGFTFPLVLRACAASGNYIASKILHGNALVLGFGCHLHVANELVFMYSKQGHVIDARNVLDRMRVRNHISWNALLSRYAINKDCNAALELFRKMRSNGVEPNNVSWVSLLSCHARAGKHEKVLGLYSLMRREGVDINAEALSVAIAVCSDIYTAASRGESLHGVVVKCGFTRYIFVSNALVRFHGKFNAKNAHKLFLEMEGKNVVSWNALIASYADAGLCYEALEIFSQLQNLKSGCNIVPDIVSWTAIISGFASVGRGETSLELFRQMKLHNGMDSAITLSVVLSVCAELTACNTGREIHGRAIRASFDCTNLVGNGLIHMYFKCGSLKEGRLVFEKLKLKDVFSWNIMILGYGTHGEGKHAVETFEKMIESGLNPDGATFVAILCACNHSGLVSEGRRYFDLMWKKYHIQPKMEHYGCMVDLLGRGGMLQEAVEIVKSMPFTPNSCVMGSLLNSCLMHKSTKAAAEISSYISCSNMKLEDSGGYILLSKIHAIRDMWEESAIQRVHAKIKGLRKIPGQSLIEVRRTNFA